jgi:hypothetical protein
VESDPLKKGTPVAFVIRKPGTRLQALLAGAALFGAFAMSTAANASTTDTPQTTPVAAAVQLAQADTPVAPAGTAAPAGTVMHPVGVTAAQQQFTPNADQLRNAKAIVEAGKRMGLPPRAWVIAIATSLQESQLKNLGDLGASNDHDSLGLFQQRPASGWGSPAQIQDPSYAATAFYKGLVQVPGWDHIALTDAAQKVQVSAYPDHYAKHEVEAGDIVRALYGEGPYAAVGQNLG